MVLSFNLILSHILLVRHLQCVCCLSSSEAITEVEKRQAGHFTFNGTRLPIKWLHVLGVLISNKKKGNHEVFSLTLKVKVSLKTGLSVFL